MICNNRKELIDNIAVRLWENDLLNEKDYHSVDDLIDDVGKTIAHELEDYKIISGNIL